MDRAAELQRIKRRQSFQRWKQRKAGLLPPLPRCPRCDSKITTDRWLPLCSRCGRKVAIEAPRSRALQPKQSRQVRLLAQAVLEELRAEARGR